MSNSIFGEFQFITLWIQGPPREFENYYPETNSLVFVNQREYRGFVFFNSLVFVNQREYRVFVFFRLPQHHIPQGINTPNTHQRKKLDFITHIIIRTTNPFHSPTPPSFLARAI